MGRTTGPPPYRILAHSRSHIVELPGPPGCPPGTSTVLRSPPSMVSSNNIS